MMMMMSENITSNYPVLQLVFFSREKKKKHFGSKTTNFPFCLFFSTNSEPAPEGREHFPQNLMNLPLI